MASYNELIALIDAFIKRNGVQAITGQILNGVLKAMVDQVGRGYAIMGVATPSTNPGTPDAPESWFASTPGTYTNFGGLEVADAEFALLSYTPSGEVWTKTTLTEGIQEVSASIDGNVGTPEVTAEYINGGLIFTFSNMKGQTGDAAGFGTVNATVDGNIGTPGVSVNTSGPDTAKNITFAFRNLKGETGVTSVVATVDNTTGSPSCSVSLVGQELHLDFHGLKGAQGDTGSSVDYPFTIVNNLTTDDPTQALSAAQGVVLDGKVSQLEAEVTDIEDEIGDLPEGDYEVIDLSLSEEYYRKSINASNQWTASSSGQTTCALLPITPGKQYKVVTGSSEGTVIAVLAENTPNVNHAADFATGFSARIAMNANEEYLFVAPEDAQTLYYLVKNNGGNNTTPTVYKKTTKTIADILSEQESVLELVPELDSRVGTLPNRYIKQDLSTLTDYHRAINAEGNWVSYSGSAKTYCVMFPITPGGSYRVIDTKGGEVIAVLAESTPRTGGAANFATGYSARRVMEQNEVFEFTAPSDVQALYLLKSNSSGAVLLADVYQYGEPVISDCILELEQKVAEEDTTGSTSTAELVANQVPYTTINGHDVPNTRGQLIAMRRAKEMLRINFTALAEYPTANSAIKTGAGEKIGYPYSSVKELRKYPWWEVSERTFMTAVHNPYSVFYTEDVSAVRSASDYGFTYKGKNCGPYYGQVCSTFVFFALGFSIPWDTAQVAMFVKRGVFAKVYDQSAQGLRLADIISEPGHVTMVTNIERNDYGDVVNVTVSEAMSTVHSSNYTANQFNQRLSSKPGVIYRYVELYKNDTIEPSEFVEIDGVVPPQYVYNDDICTYLGDYAAISEDSPMWINYTKGSYTGMKIYKDDTLVSTKSLSISPDVHKIEVTDAIDGAGIYKACLTDGTNDSDYTYWQVVDAGCSVSTVDGKLRVAFSSTNGTPWYLQVCTDYGGCYCWYEIKPTDASVGYADIDVSQLVSEQNTGPISEDVFARVCYRCDYGAVVSAMIPLQ